MPPGALETDEVVPLAGGDHRESWQRIAFLGRSPEATTFKCFKMLFKDADLSELIYYLVSIHMSVNESTSAQIEIISKQTSPNFTKSLFFPFCLGPNDQGYLLFAKSLVGDICLLCNQFEVSHFALKSVEVSHFS